MKRTLIVPTLACSPSLLGRQHNSMFVFQNNFWLNLHQFLRGEVYRQNVNAKPGLDTASLTERDRAVWNPAVDCYIDLAKRDVLFDELLRKIGNALATVGDVARLPDSLDSVIGANTRAALNSAAPICRVRVWPARKRDNQAWIALAKALLAEHETAMTARLASDSG